MSNDTEVSKEELVVREKKLTYKIPVKIHESILEEFKRIQENANTGDYQWFEVDGQTIFRMKSARGYSEYYVAYLVISTKDPNITF